MTIGSWEPPTAAESPDRLLVDKALELSLSDQLEAMADKLSPEERRQLSRSMRLSELQWEGVWKAYDAAQLWALLRFFVRAEMLLPDCEAGADSPAIWINRALKARGEKLTREELSWIRANTNNRFIPNGGL